MKIKKLLHTLFIVLITIILCTLCYFYRNDIYIFYRDNIIKERENITLTKNEYAKEKNYMYVQITNDFIADSEQEVKNIIYTVLDSGSDEFTFYCSDSYKECLNYISNVSQDSELLSNINNFVNPYNSFKTINITYSSRGTIIIKVIKNYTSDEIIQLNKKINSVIYELNIKNKKPEEQINEIHNYIINNGKYATEEFLNNNENEIYSKATGILTQGYGTCSSYADAMAIFMDKLNIENYKIASDNHVWNLAYINNKYLHLDLTWDDPILSNGEQTLDFSYFLITDERLKELDITEHSYNKNVYLETKN